MKRKRIDLRSELTLVIITRNRADDLKLTLKKLLKLPEIFNIIVVDNASKDNTAHLIEDSFPTVKLIKLNRNKFAVGRNIGVQNANTPFVAFSDDDSGWAPYSLERALNILKSYSKVGVVAARVLVNKEKKPDPINKYFESSPLPKIVDMPGPALMGFLECAAVMRKNAFLATGGYNPYLLFSGEGALLSIDMVTMGWGITYDKDVVAYHYPSKIRNMRERYRMGARNAIWRVWLRRPVKSAIKETLRQLFLGLRDINMLIGCIESIKGFPYVLKNRHVVPKFVEYQIDLLDKQRETIERKTRTLGSALRTQFGI
jgi:N-acetylglucosaminyl-diphospho-decaprenol L-rhamnosyltransferase